MTDHVDATIRNDLAEIGRLTELVEAFGDAHDFPPKLVFKITLCLDELVTNIISYAYDDDAEHAIRVRLGLDDDVLTIVVEDDGRAFDPLQQEAADVDSDIEQREVGGLGVHFLRQAMDRLAYERDGSLNRLTMEARLEADKAPAARKKSEG